MVNGKQRVEADFFHLTLARHTALSPVKSILGTFFKKIDRQMERENPEFIEINEDSSGHLTTQAA